jgi:hypothetical protein
MTPTPGTPDQRKSGNDRLTRAVGGYLPEGGTPNERTRQLTFKQDHRCPQCRILKPWPAEFYSDSSKTSGRESWCKSCSNAARAARFRSARRRG